MELSDHEKRDVVKYIESGKPLPEKYRFLLFDDKREVELVWNGKTDEVTNTVLPFQIIEQVDEPRSETTTKLQDSLFDVDPRGRQLQGWTNKLIWGDNKLILSSLKNGPLRKEIEDQGGIKLIYIDPPFDVGADFSMKIEIGDEELTKAPSVLEELAYRDTWGKGADGFMAMIYERILLMHDLLSPDGTICVHCDWRMAGNIRLVLDEIFGRENFVNEIIWAKTASSAHKANVDEGQYAKTFNRSHDSIFIYSKSNSFKGIRKTSNTSIEYSDRVKKSVSTDAAGNIIYKRGKGTMGGREIASEVTVDIDGGMLARSYWTDIPVLRHNSSDNVDYPTQKPEKLLSRIIDALSEENDLVADFFTGSGTTISVAEKLGRKWIGSDLGKFSIHTARKRLIAVQRELKTVDKDYRAFEILNLGRYERQHFIGMNPNLRDEDKQKQLARKEADFVALILGAYKAESFDGFRTFHGKKSSRLVAIGPINLPVSRLFVEEVIKEAKEKSITKIDLLAFEFEMGLFPNIQEEAKAKGIDLALKYIPRDVFDKRAIEKNQVVFHDVSYIEVKPIVTKGSVAIQLTDFSVFYNQDSIKELEETMKAGGKKIIVENGQIIKVSKDKDGIMTREMLTKKWTDWIDYWAIDYNYESKKEIIRVKNEDTGDYDEVWTGSYVFENEWQAFRTKKDRSLELTSTPRELGAGRTKVAIKVVDIFGNDTMKIIDVTL